VSRVRIERSQRTIAAGMKNEYASHEHHWPSRSLRRIVET
jgi:hypothetical protein